MKLKIKVDFVVGIGYIIVEHMSLYFSLLFNVTNFGHISCKYASNQLKYTDTYDRLITLTGEKSGKRLRRK